MSVRVGFLGAGHIGMPMAKCVLKAGFALTVYDTRPEASAELVELGGQAAKSPEEVGRQSDVLLIMVKNIAQTVDALFGERGATLGLKKGAVVVCMNTIGVGEAKSLGARLAATGLRMVDAPVSGGTHNAAKGTLVIMASGSPDALADAMPVLEAMGRKIFQVGEVGKGQALKMMNQLLCSVELVAISEALVLGAKAGIDGQTLYEVTKETSGNSAMFEAKVPKIIEGDFTPTGALEVHLKDLEIVTAAGRELGVPMILTNTAKEVLRTADAMGRGDLDGCAVVTVLEDIVGVKVRKTGVH
jgi:3-hydroxyisobutyrate dehydrogenase-like beta-hydroxyacid dehydrogenase